MGAPCSLTKPDCSAKNRVWGQTLATESRIGALNTRQALRHLGLRAVANAGHVGCWVWGHWRGCECAGGAVDSRPGLRCHWRSGQCDCGAVDRDSLYGGSQTLIDNGDGTQTVKYGKVGYNATTVALATLIGGAAGALLGTNATAAALAAQNEALNNTTSDKSVKWVKETYKDPLGDLARSGK